MTKNKNELKEFIQYLKDNRLGRATFLPLTSITSKEEAMAEVNAWKNLLEKK